MNPNYYRTKVLLDSQPAFFPESAEDTFCDLEDDNEESQYSQSLISPKPKNHQSNQVLPAKTEFFTDDDLPESQPLFTETENNCDKTKERIDMTRKRQIDNNNILNKAVEDTICNTEDDNEESQYSQTLISPKNRQSNQFSPMETHFFTDDYDLPDSQPLITEVEKNLDKAKENIDTTRKRQIDNNVLIKEESQSLSKTRRSNEANSSALTEHCNPNDCETKALEDKFVKFSNQKETETQKESALDSENGDSISSENCVDCIFDKELDKRNYYFGNLLIGELQFLPPCMRSEAYVTILKYVDSLKQQHRKRRNH